MRNLLLPRLRDILFLAILSGALALGPRMLSLDSDLGRHLAMGGHILDARQIPTHDQFSHTRAGDFRPAYEWLTQVLFSLASQLAGLDGVVTITALLIAATFMILHADAARRSGLPLTALGITILAAAASSLHWLPRPHVVTFLLLAIWLERLERIRRGEKTALWQFPVLMLIWVNAHGGFVFGMLAWVAYLAGWLLEKRRDAGNTLPGKNFLLIGATSLIATLLTPSGWGNWQAVLGNNSRYILERTIETMPPDFSQAGTWPFALLLVMGLALMATRKVLPPAHFFLLGGFALLGLLMARNIPLFAIASTPIYAESASILLQRFKRWKTIEVNIAALEKHLRGAVWPILLGLALVVFIGNRHQHQKPALTGFDARVFPVAAADWLDSNPQTGNMFNEFNWGGYLLYRLWPGQTVFLDSQTDFYGEALLREYEQALTAQEGWEAILEKYKVEWVILAPDSALALALANKGWQILYADETAILLRQQ